MDKKYFVGRIEANQVVSAYVETGQENAEKRFGELLNEQFALGKCPRFTWDHIHTHFLGGSVDFDDHSVVVREIDNYETRPTVALPIQEKEEPPVEVEGDRSPFFMINGQHQNYEVPGQTRSMLVHLTYGARHFTLIIDSGGIVMANGHLNGTEPLDPIFEQGFLWIDPHYLQENYDGEEAPTDELQIHTYDYRPNSSDEPVFSATVNFETGAVEDRTEK